jgi:magnesium-transporting ATPase (P-type)
VKHIIKEAEQGVCNVVMTGKAFDFILQVLLRDEIDDKHIACMYFLQNLSNISIIISRSSPDTKQRVVSTFKNTCDMNVMMCGKSI